jgi:hypothetical protein
MQGSGVEIAVPGKTAAKDKDPLRNSKVMVEHYRALNSLCDRLDANLALSVPQRVAEYKDTAQKITDICVRTITPEMQPALRSQLDFAAAVLEANLFSTLHPQLKAMKNLVEYSDAMEQLARALKKMEGREEEHENTNS